MDGKELVTIIVPVYNVEKYLPCCFDSILAQTYHNLEIVVVDDGSTDNSGNICDEYASRDCRIRIFHKKNEGQSSARNAGLNVAKGSLISFVDSDDCIAPNYIEEMYFNLMKYNADISTVSFFKTSDFKKHPYQKASATKSYTSTEAIKATLYQKKLNSSVWCKLFRKEIFDDVRFINGILYEDLEIIPRLYMSAKRIVWSSKKLYYYRLRNDSSIGTFSLHRLDVLDVVDRIENYIKKQYPTLLDAAQDRKLSANFNMLMLLTKNGYADSEYTDRCWHNIKSLRRRSLCDKNVRMKNKIGILASYLGKTPTQKLLTIFG